MNYKLFIVKTIIILFVSVSLSSCLSTTGKRIKIVDKPNIVFILVDDMGWNDTGFNGSLMYETPNLDNFSNQGITFTNAYAPAANCAPSRACIMSGKNTPRHGIYTVGSSERGKSKNRKLIPTQNRVTLGDGFVTLAEALRKNGYISASIGKWHIGKDPKTQGFDINIGGSHAGHPKSYFSPYKNKDLIDGEDGEYLTNRLTSEAIHFISNNKEKPFFLYLPYFTVHTPLQGEKDLIAKYRNKIKDDDRFHATLGAMIESMDTNIGRLLDTLDELKLSKNTIVIFLSDNGGIASISSQFPLRAGKGAYYEGGIRVPCVIRWPEYIKEAKKTDMPITGLDIFPTLMDIVNDKTDYNLDGNSILPLLKYGTEIEERPLFWHFPIYLEGGKPESAQFRDLLFRTRPGSVIRKGKWKLHEYFENNEFELYNLEEDLREQYDLSKENPEKVKELYQELKKWRQKVDAPVPTELNKDYVSTKYKE